MKEDPIINKVLNDMIDTLNNLNSNTYATLTADASIRKIQQMIKARSHQLYGALTNHISPGGLTTFVISDRQLDTSDEMLLYSIMTDGFSIIRKFDDFGEREWELHIQIGRSASYFSISLGTFMKRCNTLYSNYVKRSENTLIHDQ